MSTSGIEGIRVSPPRKNRRSNSPRDGPEQLDAVLEAERAAEDAVAAEQLEAERTLERARSHARRIAKRAEERVTRVRTMCEEKASRELELLRERERERADRVEELHDDPGRQRAAVERVAAWLAGASRTQAEGGGS